MDRPPDLATLHDALGCAAMAAVQAWRGDRDSASLSLIEAHAAAEEAFGTGSPGASALGVVFDAIARASRNNQRPAVVAEHLGWPSEPLPPERERTQQ